MYTSARNDDVEKDAPSTLHKARNAASAAADDLKAGARRAKHDIENGLGDAADAVREDLQDFARQTGRYVHDWASSAEEGMVTKVRENPVTAMLIAAGVGFMLSGLLRRS
jgi:ElaB/YqjD/DUF883 family membrane-anchored ribosome-binding protein